MEQGEIGYVRVFCVSRFSAQHSKPYAVAVMDQRPEHTNSRIFLVLSQYAAMQAVVAVTGLVRNKVVAYRLGPSAFGEISQISIVAGAIATLVSFGMLVSLSRNVARIQTIEERQRHLANANGIIISLSTVTLAVLVVLLSTGVLLDLVGLTENPETVLMASIFFSAIPLIGLQRNYLALLQGVLDIKGMSGQRSAAVLTATAVSVPIVWFFGSVGAAVQFLLVNGLVTLLLGLRTRRLGYRPLAFRLEPDIVLALASFGIVSMVSGFAQGMSDAAVRAALIDDAGAAANGLLQAPYVLVTTLRGIFLASVGSISLVTVASLKREEVAEAIDRLLNVVLPLAVIGLSLLGLFGSHVVIVLYSQSFAESATLFPYILVADLLLVFAWIIGSPMLAAGDRFLWLSIDLAHAGVRWFMAIILLPRLGLLGVVVGFLAAGTFHVGLIFLSYRARYGLRMSPKHGVRLLFGVMLIALLSLIGADSGRSAMVMMGAGILWLVYTAYYVSQSNLFGSIRVHRQ